jgi:hydrogenase assembly chaperone HypC/HupF
MCQILPAKVIGVREERVELELHDGQRATASRALQPDLAPGDWVLVDRGLVLEVIEAAEAEAILAIYAEMAELLEAAQ